MTAPECLYVTGIDLTSKAKRQSCIEALADGWINAPDLCPVCTRSFMAALDGIAGPLKWHQAYTDRSKGSGQPTHHA